MVGLGRQRVDRTTASIFHITNIANLANIVASGWLFSDAYCRANGVGPTNVGIQRIKDSRMRRVVTCSAAGFLGEYVPFNFCSRSVMLHRVSIGHENWSGGQTEMLHLRSTIASAIAVSTRWAFTDRHADVAAALYYNRVEELDQVPWQTMDVKYWQSVRELRQAEFIVYERFPWSAILEVGCHSKEIAARAREIIGPSRAGIVTTQQNWYY